MPLGRRSKWACTSSAILSSEIFPVPWVVTHTEVGRAMPIAYDSCTRHLLANPAATTFLAT